jgi:uncharacterized protein (PEP-CTERM system associated)
MTGYERGRRTTGRKHRYSWLAAVAPALMCTGMAGFIEGAHAQQAAYGPFTSSPAILPRTDQREEEAPTLVRGGWTFAAIGRMDLTFTDNAYLTTANRQADFIFTPQAILTAQRTGARSIVDASVAVAYDLYAQESALNGARVKALTDGTMRFADDTLSLRGRVATDLHPSSYRGVIPATERTIGGNQTQVVSYGISPGLHRPVGDGMIADAQYEFSEVRFVRPPAGGTRVAAGDATFHKASAGLSNRNAAVPLQWQVDGAYENALNERRGQRSERAHGGANGQYQVSSHFALLGRGGYEWVKEPTLITEDLAGPYALAGFLYKPTSRSSLRLEAGYRFGEPNYEGELRYTFSQRLTATASFNRGVESSQSFINDLFARARRDENGFFVDPETGALPDPRLAGFDLTDQAFRYDRARAGINGTIGRSFYQLSGTYEKRRLSTFEGESWGAQGTIGRELTRTISAAIEGRHSRTTRPDLLLGPGMRTKTTAGSARVTYLMNRTLTGTIRYVHLKHSTQLVSYRENAVVVSLAKAF